MGQNKIIYQCRSTRCVYATLNSYHLFHRSSFILVVSRLFSAMVVWTHINSFRISFYSFFIFSLFEQPVALILYLLCFLKLWLSSRKTPLCVDYKSYVINHPFTQMQKWNKFFSSGLHNMRAACACASFLNCRKCCKKPTSDNELLVQKLFQTTMTYILLWCAENLCWSIWSFELSELCRPA